MTRSSRDISEGELKAGASRRCSRLLPRPLRSNQLTISARLNCSTPLVVPTGAGNGRSCPPAIGRLRHMLTVERCTRARSATSFMFSVGGVLFTERPPSASRRTLTIADVLSLTTCSLISPLIGDLYLQQFDDA